jgi:translation initiation factor IF-3
MRLIGEEEQFGVVSREDALRIAEERGLDLVEVSPNADPPVVKLIDYGKFKYWEQKKKAEAKKKTVAADLKEIQFRPNIEKHDLEVKTRKINEILEEGDKVKLVMQFRGREMAHMATGREKFKGIINTIIEAGGIVESDAKQMGNRIIAIVASSGKKKH